MKKKKLQTQFNSATKDGGKLSHINKGVQWLPIISSKPRFSPQNSLHLIKKVEDLGLHGVAKNVYINRRAGRHSLMAHPFKLISKIQNCHCSTD